VALLTEWGEIGGYGHGTDYAAGCGFALGLSGGVIGYGRFHGFSSAAAGVGFQFASGCLNLVSNFSCRLTSFSAISTAIFS